CDAPAEWGGGDLQGSGAGHVDHMLALGRPDEVLAEDAELADGPVRWIDAGLYGGVAPAIGRLPAVANRPDDVRGEERPRRSRAGEPRTLTPVKPRSHTLCRRDFRQWSCLKFTSSLRTWPGVFVRRRLQLSRGLSLPNSVEPVAPRKR